MRVGESYPLSIPTPRPPGLDPYGPGSELVSLPLLALLLVLSRPRARTSERTRDAHHRALHPLQGPPKRTEARLIVSAA